MKTILFIIFFSVGLNAQIVFPYSLRAEWSPNSPGEMITHYNVTVNNGPVVQVPSSGCNPICTYTFSVSTIGPHTVSVLAENQWAVAPAPSTVTVTLVTPGKSGNVQIKKG